MTAHLDSGTDVVIVEGMAQLQTGMDAVIIALYDAKYEWRYSLEEDGPLTVVEPASIIAWRSAGWAGREGFREAGRWLVDPE